MRIPRTTGRTAVLAIALAVLLGGCVTPPPMAPRTVLPAGVTFAGRLERPGTVRAAYQRRLFDMAAVWAGCDAALMRRTLSAGVDFSYPTNRVIGIEAAVADLTAFCKVARERSIYFPADAFYIDVRNRRIAAEVQFRVTQDGKRQVVNDVWIATIDRDGRIAVLKEYLDGRVRQLQADGVLTYGADAAFLTPWPPRAAPPPR